MVQAQNAEKQKLVEVRTAKLEAERIAALNANAGATNSEASSLLLACDLMTDAGLSCRRYEVEVEVVVN